MERAQALVIRQADFSESSRVVTFFSREFGKFSVLAKGARRARNAFDAALDLLSNCHLVFIKKNSGALGILTEARLHHRFRPPPGDLSRLYAGYFVAELLAGMCEDEDPAETLFDGTVNCLNRLENGDESAGQVLVDFEILILAESGLFPELSVCVHCGEDIAANSASTRYMTPGGCACSACRSEGRPGTAVSAGMLEILKARGPEGQAASEQERLSTAQVREAHRLLLACISHAMGRRPSTERYLVF